VAYVFLFKLYSIFFLENFMTLSVSGIYSSNDRWLMNDGLGRILSGFGLLEVL
jgi:hypothetical protein